MKNMLVAGTTNFDGRWIYKQVSLSSDVISFMKNAYLVENLETCILYFFIIECYH
jgi:hypothetical protein